MARTLMWVVSVAALIAVVVTAHRTYITPGFWNLEFLAFVISVTVYDYSIRADERIKHNI